MLVSAVQGARRRSVMVSTELESLRLIKACKSDRKLQVSFSNRFTFTHAFASWIVNVFGSFIILKIIVFGPRLTLTITVYKLQFSSTL